MASALLFDIGVFTLVLGATGLILIALAHQSVRGHRVVHPETHRQATKTKTGEA